MAEFRGESEEFVASWLRDHNFKENVVKAFEENEVDGDGFLALTTDMVKCLIPALGPQAKFLMKHQELRDSLGLPKSTGSASSKGTDSNEGMFTSLDTLSEINISTNSQMDMGQEQPGFGEEDGLYSPENELQDNSVFCDESKSPSPKKIRLEMFHLPKDKHTKSLSTPFNLPKNYPPEVQCALSTKSMMPHTVNRFLTTIARAIYNEKCYPTAEEYSRVAQEIIGMYPFLASPVGNPHGHIEEGLKRRMKDYRRTPRSMIRSAQAGCSSNQTTPTCVEDPVSHDRHVKLMRKEFSKVHKNLALGAELMEVTFTGRRQEVIELPVKEAINRYPFLQNYEEFIREFGRVVEKNDLRQTGRGKWMEITPRIVSLAQRENSSALRDVLHTFNEEDNNDSDIAAVYALAVLQCLLAEGKKKDAHQSVIVFVPESFDMDETCLKLSQVHPLILFDGSSTFLVVEKQVICNFPVSEVAVALLASYYNFNIEYPKSLKLLGTFLDILLLDKLPKKVPAKVSMILTTLNNV